MKMTTVVDLKPGDMVQGRGTVIHAPAREQGCIVITYLLNGGGVNKMLYLKERTREPVSGFDIESVDRHLKPMPLRDRRALVQVSDVEEERRQKKAMADRGRALSRKASREASEMRRNSLQKNAKAGGEAKRNRQT